MTKLNITNNADDDLIDMMINDEYFNEIIETSKDFAQVKMEAEENFIFVNYQMTRLEDYYRDNFT